MESLDLRNRKCVSSKTAGIIVVVVVLAALVILALYLYRFSWSGFGSYINPKGEFRRYKTFWDWLQLLIVPAALALFAYWFTCQRERLARDIEESRTREARLQNYFDRMTELILDKALSSSEPGARIRDIARARTLTVVRGLDGERKGALLRFLREAHLINAPHPIIKLDQGRPPQCRSNPSRPQQCRPQRCRPQRCRPQRCRPQQCRPQQCRPRHCQPRQCQPPQCQPQQCRHGPSRPPQCRSNPSRPPQCRSNPSRPPQCQPQQCQPQQCRPPLCRPQRCRPQQCRPQRGQRLNPSPS